VEIMANKEKAWEKINKSREERPVIQDYKGYDELPPIPISFPQKGAIGKTGDWRTFKPVLNQEKCTKCGRCYLFCPEGTIPFNDETEQYEIDLIYCKGCGICAKECPTKAITMEKEER
jgi:pyruvate ferredoxin oxidoreductase delta subunit